MSGEPMLQWAKTRSPLKVMLTGGVIVLTAIYFTWIACQISPSSWEGLWAGDLPQLGEFLGGVFAPPAFLWLAFGYFLQHIELSINSSALRAQVGETQAMVTQLAEQTSLLKQTSGLTKQDAALKLVDLYLDQLSSHLSVLIYWSFESKPPEWLANWLTTAWQRFAAGDKDFFFRALAYVAPDKVTIAPVLRATIQNHREAAHAALRFKEDYPTLIAQLKALDIENIFVPLIEGGNVGRAFRYISEATDVTDMQMLRQPKSTTSAREELR